MITQQQVLDTFEYREGKLYWKVKPSNQIAVGAQAGCINSHGYAVVRLGGVLYRVHRIVFLMHNGYLPTYIDHIDGNRLNNEISNLREATASQNACNKPLQSNSKSGIKGVTWKPKLKHWCVEIQANKIRHYCGIFKDLELAELVAVEARDKYQKQFAYKGI